MNARLEKPLKSRWSNISRIARKVSFNRQSLKDSSKRGEWSRGWGRSKNDSAGEVASEGASSRVQDLWDKKESWLNPYPPSSLSPRSCIFLVPTRTVKVNQVTFPYSLCLPYRAFHPLPFPSPSRTSWVIIDLARNSCRFSSQCGIKLIDWKQNFG